MSNPQPILTKDTTPDEFAAILQASIDRNAGDKEVQHGEADILLCGMLKALGFVRAVEIFDNLDKWYA